MGAAERATQEKTWISLQFPDRGGARANGGGAVRKESAMRVAAD